MFYILFILLEWRKASIWHYISGQNNSKETIGLWSWWP